MRYLFLWSLLLLIAGCVSPKSTFDIKEVEHAQIADLDDYPQNATVYADNIRRKIPLDMSGRTYDHKYFEPWTLSEPPQTLEKIMWPFRHFTAEDAFGENLRPLPQSWFDTMLRQANFEAYGTLDRKAITLRFSHLRNLPTHKPLFRDPKRAGEGFPFDYLQNSGVHANEPLYVSHHSQDGAWVYVFTAYASGWLPSSSIAYLTTEQAASWQGGRYLHLINDGYPIKDREGRFLFYGRLGMMLPIISVQDDHYRVLTVADGARNMPTFTEAEIPRYAGREGVMVANAQTLPLLANEVMQSDYGWGGLYEERDCSSTMRDMFAPFGIWLPRNSYQQSKVGKVFSLSGKSRSEKIAYIKEHGMAFETLLYRKGHILLYLGVYKGDIMVLHDVWGIRTKVGTKEGRVIIGKTVISTLDIGDELADYDKENNMLDKLESMNIITYAKEED